MITIFNRVREKFWTTIIVKKAFVCAPVSALFRILGLQQLTFSNYHSFLRSIASFLTLSILLSLTACGFSSNATSDDNSANGAPYDSTATERSLASGIPIETICDEGTGTVPSDVVFEDGTYCVIPYDLVVEGDHISGTYSDTIDSCDYTIIIDFTKEDYGIETVNVFAAWSNRGQADVLDSEGMDNVVIEQDCLDRFFDAENVNGLYDDARSIVQSNEMPDVSSLYDHILLNETVDDHFSLFGRSFDYHFTDEICDRECVTIRSSDGNSLNDRYSNGFVWCTLREELAGLPIGLPAVNVSNLHSNVRYNDMAGRFWGVEDINIGYSGDPDNEVIFDVIDYGFCDYEPVGEWLETVPIEDHIDSLIEAALAEMNGGNISSSSRLTAYVYNAELVYYPFSVGCFSVSYDFEVRFVPVWAVYILIGDENSETVRTTSVFINATNGEQARGGLL